jgi:hypothetical protein
MGKKKVPKSRLSLVIQNSVLLIAKCVLQFLKEVRDLAKKN